MFEIMTTFMVQLVGFIPPIVALFVLFDLLGSLLFGSDKR